MNSEEIHKAFTEEFMGHKIDGVIIQQPDPILDYDQDTSFVQDAWREMALNNLHDAALEVKFFWERKDE